VLSGRVTFKVLPMPNWRVTINRKRKVRNHDK
jgi:hypothetical protein